MDDMFAADPRNDDGLPVRILWDGRENIIRLWMRQYPDVAITIDVVPEDDPDYMDKVYAQNLLIVNLYQIIMDLIEGGAKAVTDLTGEGSVTDEEIRKLFEGGFDAE